MIGTLESWPFATAVALGVIAALLLVGVLA